MLLGLFAQNVSCMKRPLVIWHIALLSQPLTPNPISPQPAEMLIMILSNQIQSFYPIFLSFSDVYRPWLEMVTKMGNTLNGNNKRDFFFCIMRVELFREEPVESLKMSGASSEWWILHRSSWVVSTVKRLEAVGEIKLLQFFCVSKGQGFAIKLQIWWQQGRKLTSKWRWVDVEDCAILAMETWRQLLVRSSPAWTHEVNMIRQNFTAEM